MKNKTLFLLLPLVLSISGCNAKPHYSPKPLDPNVTYDNVYLIMGQSNASGVSAYSYLQAVEPELYQKYLIGNSKVLCAYDVDNRIEPTYVPTRFGFGNTSEFFGPEIGIAEVLSQKEETSYIIKASFSGSCLQTEYIDKNGKEYHLYNRYVSFIKEELKVLEKQGKNPRLRGVFWMQGESDSSLDHSETYLKAEQNFLDHLRSDLNNWIYEYFNFVDAYIYTRGIWWIKPEVINDCKEQLAKNNEHCYCIKTNGEDENAINLFLKCESNEGDDLAHYDSKSMLLLGKTAGSYLIK